MVHLHGNFASQELQGNRHACGHMRYIGAYSLPSTPEDASEMAISLYSRDKKGMIMSWLSPLAWEIDVAQSMYGSALMKLFGGCRKPWEPCRKALVRQTRPFETNATTLDLKAIALICLMSP